MPEGEIRSGKHDLSVVQTRVATEHTSLVAPSLKVFHEQGAKRSIFERLRELLNNSRKNGLSAAEKRLEAVRQDQSNEPFRGFLELTLNSLDYGGNNLRIYVSQTKDEGYQIVIGDKPHGLGMSSDTLLNTYLDPYASGSATSSKTLRGDYKRGLMGVGAQQQFGLLRSTQDKLIVSATQAEETTIATFALGKNKRIEMTIGGKQASSNPGRQGVMQIIQLSKETCEELGFTPESLATYLHERLALLEGKSIDMVVVGTSSRKKTVSTNTVSSSFASGMQRAWETMQATSQVNAAGGSIDKEQLIYNITLPENSRYNLQEGGNEGIEIAISKELNEKSLVYLNVLGVRFGEPFILEGQNLPSEIDVVFHHPMSPNEGRNTVQFNREDFFIMNDLLQRISGLEIGDDISANTALRLHVLEALSPFIKQMDIQNRWIIEKGHNIRNSLEQSQRDVLQVGLGNGVKILPRSLEGILPQNMETIFASDEVVNRFIHNVLDRSGIKMLEEVGNNTYVAPLSTNEPVWISADGRMIIFNENYFPEEWNDAQTIRAKAMLLTYYYWGKLAPDVVINLLPHRNYKTPRPVKGALLRREEAMQKTQNTTSQEVSSSPGDLNERDFRELNDTVKIYVNKIQEEWANFTFHQKQDAFSRYIRMAYTDNPFIVFKRKVDFSADDRFAHIPARDEKSDFKWFSLQESELDALWDTMIYGFDNGHMLYAPKYEHLGSSVIAGYGTTLYDFGGFSTYNTFLAEAIKQQMPILNLWMLYPYSESTSMLQLYTQYHRQIPELKEFHEYWSRYNKSRPEWDFVLHHAEDLAKNANLQGEERQEFLEIFKDKDSLMAFRDKIAKVFELDSPSTGSLNLYNADRILALHPTEASAVKRIIDEFDSTFAKDLLFMAGGQERHLLSPKRALDVLIPAMQKIGVDLHERKNIQKLLRAVCESRDSIHDAGNNHSREEILLWEIYHHELPIEYAGESVVTPDEGEIHPATLLALSLSSRWKRAEKAEDIVGFIKRQSFDRSKMDVRLREQLHIINNLDKTPGSSLFELFKNSWQAIGRKGLSGERVEIRFKDGMGRSGESTIYKLSLEDKVGMAPQDALRKLLVPGEGDGVHGVHFLSALKDFDIIQIKTSEGGKIGTITLQRIKNNQDVVVDFKVFYQESLNTPQQLFVGTQIQLEKLVPASAFDIEAGISRNRISELGSSIPLQRARVILNEETLNEDHQVVFSANTSIGNIEIKPSSKMKILMAVDDTPLPRYPLSRILEDINIPIIAKKILLQSGFELNLIGSEIRTTRDNSAFQDERSIEKAIKQTVERNWQEILKTLVGTGSIDLDMEFQKGHKILPDEIWRDKEVASALKQSRGSVNWNNQENIVQWILSQPLNISEQGYYLGRVISEALAETLPQDVYDKLPITVKNKLMEAKKYQTEEPYEEFPLPPNIEEYIGRIVDHVEGFIFHNDILLKRSMIGYKGEIRGISSLAFYKETGHLYGWNEIIIEYAKKAVQGDRNAQALILAVVCHEVEHRKENSHESALAHTGTFFQNIQNALMTMPTNY